MTKKKQNRRRAPQQAPAAPHQARGPAAEREPPNAAPFPIVGVGASAGGLEAFTQLLKALPLDTGMAFVLVQHLDPEHESALTQILARATSLPVGEIADSQPVEPNHVYVIPRDASLSIAQGVLKLGPRSKTRAPHRPIDAFFESLAQDQNERAIGVVLSGTASDGTLGLEAIKAEGGITFAQDDSAKHDSMPRSAVAAGCVDLVLSPAEIARELARIAKHPHTAGQPLARCVRAEKAQERVAEEVRAEATAHEDDLTPLPSGGRATPRSGEKPARAAAGADAAGTDGYKKILLALRNHSGVDFSLYKSATIQRRIDRRMILTKHDTLAQYAGSLRGNAKELDALYSDVLISVTSFFRNPETFDALKQTVLPELLKQRGDDPLRCWVLGCSTGQEAYSLAMSFVEVAEKAPRMRNLQIFATDLNDALLEKARHGLYAKSLAEEITPERLRRFFGQEQGGYRVVKMLREMVVFARQNLIDDPPFSRMDLISCRNLLIYLEPSLQKKALPTFHYALKPHGFLLLGASESVGGFTDLFEPVDRKHKIYSRKPTSTPALHLPVRSARGAPALAGRRFPVSMKQADALQPPEGLRGELAAQREADRITVNQFAPPGVLVNAELQVLQFRGPTGAYLESPAGKASFDVLKMAREGLMLPLRATINQARKSNKIARTANVRVKQNGKTRAVDLEVIPLTNLSERCFLIVFEDAQHSARAGGGRMPAGEQPAVAPPPFSKEQEHSRIAELETDLGEMREYLKSLQEQHEAANEELQAANEEVQSANEELQSINEELETSKEELESANEELITVNEEMNHRNVELNRLNNDLLNLQTSTQLAIVLLGRDLTIRRFSPQAQKQFDLLATDVGRPIGHIRRSLVYTAPQSDPQSDPKSALDSPESPADLESIAAEVIDSVRERECEVYDKARRCWYVLRVRPYMTLDNKVDGAVLVLVDIDALKRSEQDIAAARDYAANTVETLREPLLVLDDQLRIESANRAFYRTFRVAPAETIGRFIYDLGNRQWDIPRLRTLLEQILPQRTTIEDFHVEHEFEGIGAKTMLLNARGVIDPQPKSTRILLAIEDITERRRVEEVTARLAAIVTSSEDAIISKDLDGVISNWNKGAERLFGYSTEEAVGQPITILIPEDHLDEEPRILERIRNGETIEHYETVRQRKDGSRLDISLTVSPLRDAAGRITGASKIARDITERMRAQKMLRESEDRHRTLTDQVMDYAIFRTDVAGRALTWNPGVKRILGFDEADFLGRDIVENTFIPEDVQNGAAQRELDTAAQTGSVANDRWMMRKNGERFYANGVTTSLKDGSGQLIGFTKVLRDVTAQHEMEERIKQQAGQLADESRRKDEFLAMLSHELRNPLAPIRSAVHLLRMQERGSENRIQQQAREIIERQVGNLTKLVSDLLEVSRVVSGRIRLDQQTVDLNQVVLHAAETVKPLIEQRQHELVVNNCDEPIWINADATRIEEVLINLLNNAAKYTDEGGRIEVRCEPIPGGDYAQVRVCDNGMGIDKELLPRIFDLFTQAERSLARSAGGLGIGLSLAQRLVNMHGGTIEAHSPSQDRPGDRGSEFIVKLPRLQSPELPQSLESGAQTAPQRDGMRVLVVDDNIDQVTMLASALRHVGYSVQSAHTGPDGLKVALQWRPDVVLLDIGLPGLDGYEVARRLRSDPATKAVRLIALTGYARASDIAQARAAGFDAHLSKPLEFAELEKLMPPLPA